MGGSKAKNLAILITEIAVIFLMIFNVFPREASLFITGLLIFYFIFSPLEDSLWVFIASIPLFIALPITGNFDTLANWRILSIILFLVWLFRSSTPKKLGVELLKDFFTSLRTTLGRLEYLVAIFLLISALSLLVADNIWIGLKKIIFLINAFLLFIIIKNLAANNKDIVTRIVSALKVAIGITLVVGFVQLITVFFVRLHPFWQFWARHIIPVYYGQSLSDLLSYSNTWFSYYSYQLPTLRMFSVFPDSHSFAFFCILTLPFFLTLIFLSSEKKESSSLKRSRIPELIIFYLLLIVCLLAIIFSGARGAWASAIGSFLVFLFLIFLYYSPTIRSWTDFFLPRFYKNWQRQIQLILGSLIIFFLLFPIASTILFLPQYIQLDQKTDFEKVSFFERAKSIIDFTETSVKGRLEIWQRTIDSIILHPFLGIGIGNYPLVLNEDLSAAKRGSSAHSLYLDFAAEIGIFGLLVLIAIFWQILKNTWEFFFKSNESFFQVWAGFFMLALVWTLGYSLFDVVLLNDKVLLFFIANLALLYSIKHAKESSSSLY
jgi:O-antigen ligase